MNIAVELFLLSLCTTKLTKEDKAFMTLFESGPSIIPADRPSWLPLA